MSSQVSDYNLKGLLSARPASSLYKIGSNYFATDTGQLFRDNGTTWDDITPFGVAYEQFTEAAAPGTPSAGVARLYVKSDHLLYWKDSTGTERAVGSGSGTVTSVGLTVPTGFAVSGSPITGAGTLAVTENTQSANQVKAGPSSGGAAAPGYRALVAADLPALGTAGTYKSTTTDAAGRVSAGTALTGVSTEMLATGKAVKTVANTVTRTSLVPGTILGAIALGAGALNLAGRTLRERAWGTVDTNGFDAVSTVLEIKLGSTSLASFTFSPAAANNALWWMEAEILCMSTGASGTVRLQGQFSFMADGTSVGVPTVVSFRTTAVSSAVDLTAALTPDFLIQWGAASASNTITCTHFSSELLN